MRCAAFHVRSNHGTVDPVPDLRGAGLLVEVEALRGLVVLREHVHRDAIALLLGELVRDDVAETADGVELDGVVHGSVRGGDGVVVDAHTLKKQREETE